MKVEEFIKVLETFPQDADIGLCNAEGEFEGTFLFGLVHDSEYDYESGSGYNVVGICCLEPFHQKYIDLIYGEHELYGEKVWYNTIGRIDEWDCEGNRTRLYFDDEVKKFYDWNKRMGKLWN